MKGKVQSDQQGEGQSVALNPTPNPPLQTFVRRINRVKGKVWRDHQKMGDLTRETDRMKVYLLLLLDSRYRS